MKRKIFLFCLSLYISQFVFGKQWIVFCSEGIGPHAYVTFVKEDPATKVPTEVGTWGFHPLNDPWYVKLLFENGTVLDNSGLKADNHFISEITAEEWYASLATKDRYTTETYSIVLNNCIDFLVAIASNIKFLNHIPSTKISPWTYVSLLKAANSEWAKYSELSYAFSAYAVKKSIIKNEPSFDLSEGAKLLFDKNEAMIYVTDLRLSSKEKEEIYQKLNLNISNDKKELFGKNDKKFEYPFYCSVRIIDLNNDGKLEVFVSLSNLEWFGQAGEETAFGKSPSESYYEILKVNGFSEFLTTSFNGYPDLITSGPGMTAPSQRWNGTKYQFYKTVPYGATTAPKTISFEDYYRTQKAKKR